MRKIYYNNTLVNDAFMGLDRVDITNKGATINLLALAGNPLSSSLVVDIDGNLDAVYGTNIDQPNFNRTSFPIYTSIFAVHSPSGSDSVLYYGGNFNEYDGVNYGGGVYKFVNGVFDTNFAPGSGSGAPEYSYGISSITTDSTGSVYAKGTFNGWNGDTSYQGFIKLNENGSVNTTMGAIPFLTGSGGNVIIDEINNELIIGGTYNSGSINRRGIWKFDKDSGERNTMFETEAFTTSSGATIVDNGVNDFILSGSSIFALGQFDDYGGNSEANFIVKLDDSGSLDTSFVAPPFTHFDNQPADPFNTKFYVFQSIMLDSNNKLMIGGVWENCSGSSSSGIARLNQNGSRDTTFDVGNGFREFSSEGDGVTNILEYNNQYFCSTTFNEYDNTTIGRGNVLLDQTGSIANNYGGSGGAGFDRPSATIFQRETPSTNLI
tara:strand:+ start:95 stop:1399 length:1305 start_codon:yes stop_codon:yes gene_type:complete